ncbi:hypothetical protein BV20DRAFT_678695 [Pilatotrama ljubarskyi]|nr:hypothetical protein BV20DRAFT_678695 [Pilatotrama ljubarskyi]
MAGEKQRCNGNGLDTPNGLMSSSSSTTHNSPSSCDLQAPHVHVSSVASPSQAGSSRQASSSTSPVAPANAPRRRIRPKIALDPNQPLTAQGKQRARVYVACKQCRARKTRCDGAKPVCFHCRKRPSEDGEPCSYEPQPKRRGQDRTPGTRVRKSRKRRRTSTGEDDDTASHSSSSSRSSSNERSASRQRQDSYEHSLGLLSDECTSEYDPFVFDSNGVIELPSANAELYTGPTRIATESIPSRPSLRFTRETWWDALLTFYASDDERTPPLDPGCLTMEQRSVTMRAIVLDLRALFQSSLYWVSFIHLPRFFDAVLNPTRRATMQPALLLSALALGTLAQSSEAEKGAPGRVRALKLLDMADSALQASLASGWVDIGLIQATWLIVYFEMQSHPQQSADRGRSSLLLLDSLMRLFSLTTLDADLKRACSSGHAHNPFSANQFPFASAAASFPTLNNTMHIDHVFSPMSGHTTATSANSTFGPPLDPLRATLNEPLVPDHFTLGSSTTPSSSSCNCASFAISHHWPSVQGLAPSWAGTLMWPTGLSEGEFQKEECRRLVWSSVMLTASLNAYTSLIEDMQRNYLSIKDPRNFALMYPGESLALTGSPVQANNVWTLYLRSMLLLHSCVRMRYDPLVSEAQRAEFAMEAWLEIDAMENALDRHTCGLEASFGYQAREMLFSSRMCVSHEFQRYIPQVTTHGSRLFYRDKAESWLKQRMEAAERVWGTLMQAGGSRASPRDFRKPLLIYWFMSHVVKALVLWKADPTLTIALTASKSFVKRAEYLMMYWPSVEQRKEWQGLRYQLVEACLKAGIAPPDAAIPTPFPGKKPSTSV